LSTSVAPIVKGAVDERLGLPLHWIEGTQPRPLVFGVQKRSISGSMR
jgi:hypothetical protein